MRFRWPLGVIFFVACAVADRAEAKSPVEGGKVFVGPMGIQVLVVPLLPASEKHALLEVTGSSGLLDGKAFLVEFEDDGDLAEYRGKIHGRGFHLLVARRGRYEAWLPGRRDGVVVTWDEKLSKAMKADDVWKLNQKQTADGTLAAIERFDRAAETAGADKELAAGAQAVNKSCGSQIAVRVNWASLNDETMLRRSESSYCGEVLSSMARLCAGSAVGKRAVVAAIKDVVCQWGAALAIDVPAEGKRPGTLTWTTSADSSNLGEFATAAFERDLGQSSAKGDTVFQDPSLKGQIFVEKTSVCSDGKSHFVVVAPDEKIVRKLFVGDGKSLAAVRPPEPHRLSGSDFYDPRFFNKSGNPDFDGIDMRVYGVVEARDGKCTVRCGERTIELSLLDADAARAMLTTAKVSTWPAARTPYAMARDEHGKYYYVDTGSTPATEKNFRLFVGQRGGMKLQKMTNVVSDSEGEIFSTKTGSLRFIFSKGERSETLWIAGSARTKLLPVKVSDNLPLIFNDLGVYTGERLGTPCDDL